jgi:outer membrane biosynthesis protein TonB
MISEIQDEQQTSDDRATLVWSLLVSSFVNLMAWMLAAWSVAVHLQAVSHTQRVEPTFMISSSSIHIAQHSHPVPRMPTQPVAQPQKPQQPKAQQPPTHQTIPKPQAQPTEIARIVPSAPPQPRSAHKSATKPASLAAQLAQQEIAFQHEAQQLNAQRAPLSIATIDPNQRESSTREYKMNFSGNTELAGKGQGFLYPLRRWIDSGQHCYYGRYYWQYPTGGTEVANIPWPFCFAPNQDPLARGLHQFPFPFPPPGYRLPAGTHLYPIESDVYQAFLSDQ